ncbi:MULTISPECIES: O-methyltransferase [unclassified Paenibacillus]|uniref:O-methyltransferase n=1 Tax=unclassified Paenibacillus TaxID=185978 RepID=UPI001AE91A43|nr:MULTISPECIES: O-methyltransferase [unclassified Paenibacillus]MBP1154722.1 putative O-methyltransferase YrrM [Paenibacillus sp. PvP091]MBP1169894.1 putative O-methyltransferase YrrM [Paenibacillus sp. PvR098]MBP2440922.1 putative O-methyltransferase YrrM [Paenibacillus sp. PvP052]
MTAPLTPEQYPEQYLEALFETDEPLERVKVGIRANNMPEISIAPGYGRLLTMLVRISGARQVLEIGALGGYSGICLARGLPQDGKLVSLELKQDYADLAHKHLREAGFEGKVEYRVGEALDSLKALDAEGRRFDLFFIDADKGNYPNYLEWAIKLGHPGAIILGDNLLMRGKAMNPGEKGNAVTKMRQFTEAVARDPRLEGVLLPAYDGLAIARVREYS